MIRLQSRDLGGRNSVYLAVHYRDRSPHGQDSGSRWYGRLPWVAWELLVMGGQGETDVPLDDSLHEEPQDRAQRQGGKALGLLPPPWTKGRGMLAPPTAGLAGRVLRVIRLDPLRLRTHCQPSGRRED
jgi:hypothetical protein